MNWEQIIKDSKYIEEKVNPMGTKEPHKLFQYDRVVKDYNTTILVIRTHMLTDFRYTIYSPNGGIENDKYMDIYLKLNKLEKIREKEKRDKKAKEIFKKLVLEDKTEASLILTNFWDSKTIYHWSLDKIKK